ncbi:MAG: prepilin-type N-terminal cleavage/methylation domain-containing protein [Alphaproteobacteria bacterium]
MDRRAFTLVELAIVLVIIGLLVGGVLTGADLIKSAQLYSINQGKEDIVAATMTFRDKYGRLPGDWMHATDTFGILNGTGSDATSPEHADPRRQHRHLHGNGDGYLGTSVVAGDENYRFFQQLGAAGLIKGSYTGTNGTNSGYVNGWVAGVNMPEARQSSYGHIANWFRPQCGKRRLFCGELGPCNSLCKGPTHHQRRGGLDARHPDACRHVPLRLEIRRRAARQRCDHQLGRAPMQRTIPCTNKAGVAPPADAGATYNLNDGNQDCEIWWLRVF